MAKTLNDIMAPAKKRTLGDIIDPGRPVKKTLSSITTAPQLPTGADPNKPLNFVDNNIPSAGIPGIVDPKDVGHVPGPTFRERAVKSYKRGQESIAVDKLGFRAFLGEISDEDLFAASDKLDELNKADPIESGNIASKTLLTTAAILPPMIEGYGQGIKYGTAAAGAAAVAGQLGPQAAFPEEIATVPGAFGGGLAVGGFKYWSEQGTGAIYLRARKEGVSPKTAKIAASIGGPIYGWIEHSQIDRIIPGLSRVKGGLSKIILRFATNWATEVGEEGLQKGTEEVAVKVSRFMEGQIDAADIPKEAKESLKAVWEETKAAAGPMLILQGPGTGVAITSNIGRGLDAAVIEKPGPKQEPTKIAASEQFDKEIAEMDAEQEQHRKAIQEQIRQQTAPQPTQAPQPPIQPISEPEAVEPPPKPKTVDDIVAQGRQAKAEQIARGPTFRVEPEKPAAKPDKAAPLKDMSRQELMDLIDDTPDAETQKLAQRELESRPPEKGVTDVQEPPPSLEITDEELGGITKPERRRLIKETADRIKQSDIYQGDIEALEDEGRQVGGAGGLVYVGESGRGEVQEAIQNHPRLRFHITFDRSKGGSSWDQVAQEAGAEEMDLTEFLERYGKALEATKQEGGLSTAALETFEGSGLPHEQLLAEKHKMLVAGNSDLEINNMISEWAELHDQPPESMEDEYVSEYGTKIKQIKAMDPAAQDAALERLAEQQIEEEERSEAAKSAIEVLEANDIVPDVREVEKIPEDIGLDDLPFERRGKPVGAAIFKGKLPEGYTVERLEVRIRGKRFEARDPNRRVIGYFRNYKKGAIAAWTDKAEVLNREQNARRKRLESVEAAGEILKANKIKLEIKEVEKIEMMSAVNIGGLEPVYFPGLARGAATQGQVETILLAYGADSETGYHEAYHILRRRLTDKDHRVLDKYFKKDEEAEARAFATFAKKGKARTFLKGIWQKLVNILKRVKNRLQGRGFKTAEDVFEAIRKGTVEKVAPSRAQVRFETSGEKARREVDKKARINARKAKLAAEHGIKPKKVPKSRFKIKINDKTPLLKQDPHWQDWSPRPGGGAFGVTPIPKQDPRMTPPLSAELYPDTILDELVADPRDIKEKKGKQFFTDEWYKDNIKAYKDSRVEIFKDKAKGLAASFFKGADYLIGASSTRLYNIHPELFRQVRRYVYNMLTRTTDQLEEVEPFLKKFKALPKEDYKRLDLALKNSDKREIDRVVDKYDMRAEYEVVRDVLNDIYAAAKQVGIEMDYKSDYWHRELSDPRGFLKYFQGTEYWSIIEAALQKRAERAGRTVADLTVEEKAQVVNTLLRGFRTQALTLARPGAAKERTVDAVFKDINHFYDTSETAIVKYIKGMNAKIAEREFFGKETKEITDLRKLQSTRLTRMMKLGRRVGLREGTTEGQYKTHISKAVENYKADQERLQRLTTQGPAESIGRYVMDLQQEGKIRPDQEQELQNILIGIFHPKGFGKTLGGITAAIYIDTLGSPLQALTQLDEFAYAMVRSPLHSIPALVRAIARKSLITPRDIGITSIGKEFQNASMKKALTTILRTTGFEEIDRINKEIFINTALAQMQAQAKKLGQRSDLRKRLARVFGSEYKQVLEDLQKPIKSLDDVTDSVKYLLLNDILDIQPLAVSEMPEPYNRGGKARIFYTLKTFYIKRLDFVRNESFKKMKHKETFAEGFGTLVWLMTAFALLGAGSDFLKDFIRGRSFDLADSVIDSILRIFMSSKFQVMQAKREGAGKAVVESVFAPPTKSIDAVTRDIINVAEGKDRGFELWRSVPVGGELYYWWFGAGADRNRGTTKGTGTE